MGNKIDKVIETVAPAWAYRRSVARHNLNILGSVSTAYTTQSGGYRGGHYGRLRGAPGRATHSEDNAASWTYKNMIANAMQLYRDDPMTRSIVDVCTTYLGESVPTAVTTDPDGKPSKETQKWNKLASEYFRDYWWGQADARRRPGVDYGELQILWDRWCWLGGDMLFLLMDGALMPYEGLQMDTPYKLHGDKQIVNGVRIEKTPPWRITHYYVNEGSQADSVRREFKRIRQNQAIYAGARNWRVSMMRSVPDLHSVIDALHTFNKTTDNVQKRIEFESMLFTIERKGALGRIPGSTMRNLDSSNGTQVEHSKADWGMRLKVNGNGPIDDQFKLAQMQNPQSNYTQTMEHMARIISAGTGFPYEIVMHVYTNGSYTANRAARLDFAKALMSRWSWRNKVLNQRVWNWKIASAMKNGELPLAPIDMQGRSQWYKTSYTLPHFPHIDEGKEVVADMKQWRVGQESLADWGQQKGLTRDQLLEAHDEDIRAMKIRSDALDIPLEQYMGGLFTASSAQKNQAKEKGNEA